MAKRNGFVVISSDDEGGSENRSLKGSRTRSSTRNCKRPKSSSSSTSSRGKKRARDSASRSRLSKLHEISLFEDDFNDVFTGSKVSAGTRRSIGEDLWVDKYKPLSVEELAVHKKKVDEVKMWFDERVNPSKDVIGSNVLVITGQAGVGKSATIHVIASHLGAVVCGWDTPTPVLWQEHLYNSGAGVKYTSKLEEFETFVERIRKYGVMSASLTSESKPSVILLIDDLPLTNGKAAFGRLKDCLHLLVRSAQVPTAILFTDYGNTDSADPNARNLHELQLSLESSGACKVAFNPITTNSIKKVLFRIHAITSLQFFCLKPNQVPSFSQSADALGPLQDHSNTSEGLEDGYSLNFGRDETLNLFHALGKFLHNKREAGAAVNYDQHGFHIQERFSRLPLKMDVPEKILSQAHVQPGQVADFLHENVLEFVDDEAIDDACTVSTYLGDADILLSKLRGTLSSYNEAESMLQSAAASIAVRGVLFGNSHVVSSRWHAIRRPNLWQVEKSSLYNKDELFRLRDSDWKLSSYNTSVMAMEYMPMQKLLGDRACYQDSVQDLDMEDVDVDKMNLDAQEDDDDDIEDW
ncbi:cell cycle checkpoint protein RAD17 [Arachis ipaensis]|uniref:cell cycle checkpoint protein RAD17 n=1 Tax=Arachis ipaensis TaxID=130454 RepID=UPI0007AEEA77|nr:cell cycle checkpoint protein RAD17 [Arachis ipaensis]